MACAPDPDIAALVGSWRLLSFVNTFSDSGERIESFGTHPDGRMVLEPGGRIMFLFMTPNRQPPASDADRAALFNTMVAYSGKVRLDGPGRLITTVDLAWSPPDNAEQLRLFTLDNDLLSIRTLEQTIPTFGSRLLVSELLWQRE